MVIGAGISGLAAAKALKAAGREVVVVDKGRGVGGRCATRRLDGQAVDHGIPWFHGTDPDFLCAFDSFEADEVDAGWPRRVTGTGPACNPKGLDPGSRRFALRDGASAFPKRLAEGLDVRLGVHVEGLSFEGDGVEVSVQGRSSLRAEQVVVAVPTEQASALLGGLGADRGVAAARFVLSRAGSVACLTVMGLYDLSGPEPAFDVCLPDVGGPVALISHDSSKRRAPTRRALVIQATPGWSRAHLDADPERWSAELFGAAAGLIGGWVDQPVVRDAHRWRYARVDPVYALRGPVVVRHSGGAKVVVTGEAFHEGSGAQGAFLAGQRAAARILES